MHGHKVMSRLSLSFAKPWVLLGLMLVQACSFVEHWDEAGLACDSTVVDGRTNFCLDGYTCFNPSVTCIRDASRNAGQACTDARQCQADQLCPIDNLSGTGIAQQDDVQTCLTKCQSGSANGGYYQADGCLAQQYCAPFLDTVAQASTATLVGGCVQSNGCGAGTYCTIDNQPGGICVPISSSANACIAKCDITWASTATYSDSCATDEFCQPLGLTGAKQFVCLKNTRNVQPDDASCSPIEAPCKSGSVCSPQSICAPYCELTGNSLATTGCGTNQKCCPFSNYGSAQASGYCINGTSCP